MAYTEAAKRATIKYQKKAYDRMELKVKKGGKEIIKKRAEQLGKSVNAYLWDLVIKDLKEHEIDTTI